MLGMSVNFNYMKKADDSYTKESSAKIENTYQINVYLLSIFEVSCVHTVYQHFSHLRFEYNLTCKAEIISI